MASAIRQRGHGSLGKNAPSVAKAALVNQRPQPVAVAPWSEDDLGDVWWLAVLAIGAAT
jgi:hypothetical protein